MKIKTISAKSFGDRHGVIGFFAEIIACSLIVCSILWMAGEENRAETISSAMADGTGTVSNPLNRLQRIVNSTLTDKLKMQFDVSVNEANDPFHTPFKIYHIHFTAKNGNPASKWQQVVAVVEKDGKAYLIQGNIVDLETGEEIFSLWQSLANRIEIATDQDHLMLGDNTAPVIIVAFRDFTSPRSRMFIPSLANFASMQHNIALYLYDLTPVISRDAEYLARIGIAWRKITGEDVPREIYNPNLQTDEQAGLFEQHLIEQALDRAEFYKMASSLEVTERIKKDKALAQMLGVEDTQWVFVNGHRLPAQTETIAKFIKLIGDTKITDQR